MDKIPNLNQDNETINVDESISQFALSGLHIKEDDRDWGSGGMNDIQEDSTLNQ